MVHLLEQELLALQRGRQTALMPLTLDRHPQDIGGALEEREIMLDELVLRSAVDLEHAVRLSIPLQGNVHGAVNAVSDQNFGRPEALLVLEMIGDHWPASFQREAGR